MTPCEIVCVPKAHIRRVRLAVYRDGRVRVVYPRCMPLREVESFVRAQSAWIARARERWNKRGVRHLAAYQPTELKERSAEALRRIAPRVEAFAQVYGVRIKRLVIRQPATRWGSCSRQGVLMFNVRLLALPDHLVDYLIVHELAHLCEFNHSPKFWAQVARHVPNYRALRQELRTHYLLE